MNSLHQARTNVVRLERYCRRTKDKIWAGTREDLFDAMADCAEAAEIARRLYTLLQRETAPTETTAPHA
jgi:hypothetical protein